MSAAVGCQKRRPLGWVLHALFLEERRRSYTSDGAKNFEILDAR